MKNIIILFLFTLSFSASAQTYFDLEKDDNYKCNWINSMPQTTDLSSLKKYSDEKIIEIFNELVNNSNIEFNYPQGGCQHRAQIMSMFLESSLMIEHSKVWLFAPIDLEYNRNERLFIEDPNDITTDSFINWNYHVAPIIINSNNDTLVIDPSIDNKEPMLINDWLNAIGNSRISKYTFINPDNYFFYVKQQGENLTNTISGCFYQYTGFTKDNFTLEKGLALNDIAIAFYNKYVIQLQNSKPDSQQLNDLKLIFGNATTIGNIFSFNNENYSIEVKNAIERQVQIVSEAQNSYDKKLKYWKKVINKLEQ
jgi:hypothetical protein